MAGVTPKTIPTRVATSMAMAKICQVITGMICKDKRGECRCPQHGGQLEGQWIYKAHSATWQCDVESLLALDPRELSGFGQKIKSRILFLIQYLSERLAL